jgi:hypothetical protein
MRGHWEARGTCRPRFNRTMTCQSLGEGGASALKSRGRCTCSEEDNCLDVANCLELDEEKNIIQGLIPKR